VGTAPDGLGDEDIRPGAAVQVVRGFQKRVEAAAEAAAGDLLHGEALRPQERGVHQAAALVVADEADAQAAVDEPPGQAGDGGRFPGAEEPADHDVPRSTWTHAVCPASCRSWRRGP